MRHGLVSHDRVWHVRAVGVAIVDRVQFQKIVLKRVDLTLTGRAGQTGQMSYIFTWN